MIWTILAILISASIIFSFFSNSETPVDQHPDEDDDNGGLTEEEIEYDYLQQQESEQEEEDEFFFDHNK